MTFFTHACFQAKSRSSSLIGFNRFKMVAFKNIYRTIQYLKRLIIFLETNHTKKKLVKTTTYCIYIFKFKNNRGIVTRRQKHTAPANKRRPQICPIAYVTQSDWDQPWCWGQAKSRCQTSVTLQGFYGALNLQRPSLASSNVILSDANFWIDCVVFLLL